MKPNLADLLNEDDDAFLTAVEAGDAESDESSAAAAPRASDPAPADDSAPPADADDASPPRDERGRFAPKAADAPPEDGIPDPSAPPASDAPTTPTDPAAPPPEATTAQPFVVKADGREVPIAGATYVPGKGLTIPDAQVPQVRQLLSRGIHHETTGRAERLESQRTIRTLQQQLTEKSQRESLADQFFQMVRELPEDQLLTQILAFRDDLPRVERELMQQEIQALREGRAPQMSAASPEPSGPPDAETVSQSLTVALQSCETIPGAQHLTPADWQDLRAAGDALGTALVKTAAEDLLDAGVLAGQAYFDAAPLVTLVQQRIALRQAQHQQTTAMAAAAKANAQQTAGTKAPPAASPRAATVAAGTKPAPKGKQDWERTLADLAKDD